MPPPFKKYKTGRVSHGPAFLFCFKIQIAAILPKLSLIIRQAKMQIWSRYLARAFVGRIISGAYGRRKARLPWGKRGGHHVEKT
jgi:hypothetical protein